jgi:hypothetical protein
MLYAQRKSIENTYIVRERDKRRSRELLALVLCCLPVALFLGLFTWQNLEVIRLGREATRLGAVRADLEKNNRNLRLEVERLTSLDNVEGKAAAMGFRAADKSQVVTVALSGEAARGERKP